MTKYNTIYDLVPGKLYKHTWILLASDTTNKNKKMPFKTEDGVWSTQYLDTETPLFFVGMRNTIKLPQYKTFTDSKYYASNSGLFIYKQQLIVMEHFQDIHYQLLST